jgi:hypothetical protein
MSKLGSKIITRYDRDQMPIPKPAKIDLELTSGWIGKYESVKIRVQEEANEPNSRMVRSKVQDINIRRRKGHLRMNGTWNERATSPGKRGDVIR